jgi:hypothetical protein
LRKSTELKPEFWVETPSGKLAEQATMDIKGLSVGEEARTPLSSHPRKRGTTPYTRIYTMDEKE